MAVSNIMITSLLPCLKQDIDTTMFRRETPRWLGVNHIRLEQNDHKPKAVCTERSMDDVQEMQERSRSAI